MTKEVCDALRLGRVETVETTAREVHDHCCGLSDSLSRRLRSALDQAWSEATEGEVHYVLVKVGGGEP